jgi:RNA polymerase sigma-70 factor (ECF subfamily)
MASPRTPLRLIQGSSNDGFEGTEVDGDEAGRGPDSEAAAIRELGDDSLVTLAAQGDMRAAEMLYRRHAAFALNLAVRIAGSSHDVEDVVHDAFLRAFDSLASLRNPKAFKSWLEIVVHAVRSRLRRARLMRMLGLGRGGDVDIDCIASEDASPRVRAELAQVYALLQTLSPDDRIAWTLRFVEGHDLKAAAELSNCSLATVKRRILRAQRYIDSHFVPTGDESQPGEAEVESDRRPSTKERAS